MRNSLLIRSIGVIAVVAALAGGTTQQPTELPLYLTVLSPDGQAVSGLTADDFQLQVDGRPADFPALDSVSEPYRLLVIDECTGDYPRSGSLFLQAEMVRFMQAVRRHERVAFAQFGETLSMLRHWKTLLTPSTEIRLRKASESFGTDCQVHPQGEAKIPFEDKLDWIEAQMEGVAGRIGVVWFGPPKNVPGEFIRPVARELLPESRDNRVAPIEDDPNFQRVLGRMKAARAAFTFVLLNWEFSPSFPGEAERKRRYFLSLKAWSEASGGTTALWQREVEPDALAEKFSMQQDAGYRLVYRPGIRENRYHSIEVSVRNDGLRIIQSRSGFVW